jgi:hypothetical protein
MKMIEKIQYSDSKISDWYRVQRASILFLTIYKTFGVSQLFSVKPTMHCDILPAECQCAYPCFKGSKIYFE